MSDQTGAYVTWIAELFPEQGNWREDDYFALPDSNRIIELSNGEIIMSPPPVPKHQLIADFLTFDLTAFVRGGKLGKVISSPVAVRLWQGKIREPDILFLRSEHLDRIGKRNIDGGPDWVAEIISPGSRETDENEKLLEYAQAGVPEYWLLDPENETIRVYVLKESTYELHFTYRRGDVAKAQTIPGFEIAVNEVFDA